MKRRLLLYLLPAVLTVGCKKERNEENKPAVKGTFAYDLTFLQKHKETIVLTAPDNADSRVLVVPGYQGRVMTSTAAGDSGNSYGWINYNLIESGQYQPHMNGFGGEERFWLSPEGGQFSVYFKKRGAF